MPSILDYRKVEYVSTAGLPITTFMAEDPQIIWVSITDLTDALALDDSYQDGVEEFIVYSITGKPDTHLCIPHTDINYFLHYTNAYSENIRDFRAFFAHEVMSFWNRFQYSASNLTIREALMKVDNGASSIADGLGIPLGRIREFIFECMGFDVFPDVGTISTEEYSFMAYAEIQYLCMATQYVSLGESLRESLRQVEQELKTVLSPIGMLTRGYSELCNTK